MNCILIFDQLNDIVFTKYNKKFLNHVKKLSRIQGLISEEQDVDDIGSSIIIQLFSPIVTSQRIMSCQFGNSYTSIQCQDGTNMVMDEYMGYLFVHIGIKDVIWLKRMIGICITIVKHICGPDVSLLKKTKNYNLLLSHLLDTWIRLQDSDQAALVEAIEQLLVNMDLNSATMKALQEATEKLKSQTDFSHVHALVLVQNKFLSLYSSRNAQDLSAADIIFLSLLCESLQFSQMENVYKGSQSEAGEESSDEFYSPPDSPDGSLTDVHTEGVFKYPDVESTSLNCSSPDGLTSLVVLLMGNSEAAYNPHVVHICMLEEGVFLLLIIETGNYLISLGLSESLDALNAIQNVQLQKDLEGVKHTFESLEAGIKKLFDGLRKNRNNLKPAAERCHKKLQSKWDFIRKKYVEFMKTMELDCIVRIESSTTGFIDTLKELLVIVCFDTDVLSHGRDVVNSIVSIVRSRLADFSDFLKVKALRNFTLGSRASLTINKYLEEFPGLVHFLFINRSSHRITVPSLDFTSEETNTLTKKKIWSMVEFSREHLQDGHLALMWKDTTFNYAYFLWFEDSTGSPLKVKVFPTTAIKNFPMPGIMCGDFYRKLVETCFPKMSPNKVNCYELYCIHLGLATASCVLEHSRRLAATIWEVTGIPNNPSDLL